MESRNLVSGSLRRRYRSLLDQIQKAKAINLQQSRPSTFRTSGRSSTLPPRMNRDRIFLAPRTSWMEGSLPWHHGERTIMFGLESHTHAYSVRFPPQEMSTQGMIVVIKIGVSLYYMRLSRDSKKHDVADRSSGSAQDLQKYLICEHVSISQNNLLFDDTRQSSFRRKQKVPYNSKHLI